jgi:hypothetical protein
MLQKWFVGLAIMLAVAGLAGAPAPAEAAVRPRLSPNISVSTAGSGLGAVFTVTGSGFMPNSPVYLRVSDSAGRMGTLTQSADGSGRLNAVLPALALPVPVQTGNSITFQTIFQYSNPFMVVYP